MNKVEVTRKFLKDFQLVFGGYLHPKFISMYLLG